VAQESKRQARKDRQYEELNEYRDLLQPPETFESGFTRKTIIGVFFIAFIMTPGQMYLSLVTGIGIGEAAQWVTVILFLEIAKRSFTTLKRQEIFLLTYVASQLIVRAETQTFLQLIWRQYFVSSPEAAQFGLTDKLVALSWHGMGWFSPHPDSPAIIQRTFLHQDWLLPILLLVVGIIVSRVTWFTSGYVLFRLVSDREKLPFPTAPQAALGAMALAEESGSESQSWKWPAFTVGGAIGLVFGFIYVAIPTLTETFAGKKVEILPIPFADLTPVLGRFFGATPIGISFSLSPIFAGLLLPFWSVMGSFAFIASFMVMSPILHHYGYMPHWVPGMSAVQTQITAGVDFWQPFAMGVTLSVAIISITQVIRAGREKAVDNAYADEHGHDHDTCRHPQCDKQSQVRGYCLEHLNRGDFRLWVCITLFFLGAAYPILLAKTLFPTLVTTGLLVVILIIAFIYAPLMSFVSARLDGLVGQNIVIPHLHEGMVFLTGYRGVEIWFVPLAGADFGGGAETFRIIELTGMRFTSLLKAEIVMVPIVLGASLLYWSFLWKLAPIPSDAYPYVQTFWPARAFGEAVKYSATQYSIMYEEGEEADGHIVPPGEVRWSPANLQDKSLYYWRSKVTADTDIKNPDKRTYGPWSETGWFTTDFTDAGGVRGSPELLSLPDGRHTDLTLSIPVLGVPQMASVVSQPETLFRARLPEGAEAAQQLGFLIELDTDPKFRGDFFQSSAETPMFFQIYWQDPKSTGDGRDEDFDGVADEEVVNQKDDDGDGAIDEDIHHPLNGEKWPILLLGLVFGVGVYTLLSFFGMPMFFVWGYIRGVASVGVATFFLLLTEVIGALLAKYYFWPKFGKQHWRQMAMVLAVGFGVGISLVGMFCAATLMISKAVSATTF
jgi:hypothetical protein